MLRRKIGITTPCFRRTNCTLSFYNYTRKSSNHYYHTAGLNDGSTSIMNFDNEKRPQPLHHQQRSCDRSPRRVYRFHNDYEPKRWYDAPNYFEFYPSNILYTHYKEYHTSRACSYFSKDCYRPIKPYIYYNKTIISPINVGTTILRRTMITKAMKKKQQQEEIQKGTESSQSDPKATNDENNTTTSEISPSFQKANNKYATNLLTNTATHSLILPNTTSLGTFDDWNVPVTYDPIQSPNASSDTIRTTNRTVGFDYKGLYDPKIHLPSSPTVWDPDVYEEETPLCAELIAYIGVTGRPITVADYMRSALQHPLYGYYTNAISYKHGQVNRLNNNTNKIVDDFDIDAYDDTTETTTTTNRSNDNVIIGPRGDFITSPEITQMFGECIAVWFLTQIQLRNRLNSTTATPTDYQLLELGPGKGTLMVDIITFIQQFERQQQEEGEGEVSLSSKCKYIHFIETSPALRSTQKESILQRFSADGAISFVFDDSKLGTSTTSSNTATNVLDTTTPLSNNNKQQQSKTTIHVQWHDTIMDFQLWQKKNIPNNNDLLPTYCIGQEFLDALPVYAFEKTKHGYWRERMVDVVTADEDEDVDEDDDDDTNETANHEAKQSKSSNSSKAVPKIKKPRLRIVLAPEVTPALKTLLKTDSDGYMVDKSLDANAPTGTIVEVCPEAILLVQDIANILSQQGGAALFIDYGTTFGSRDSIRAYTQQEQVHFLSQPGRVDITADVDFAALKHAVNSSTTKSSVQAYGPITQGDFLMAMGIQERVVSLIEKDDTSDEMAENLYDCMIQLASPEHMGERYKVLSIAPLAGQGDNNRSSSSTAPPGFENNV